MTPAEQRPHVASYLKTHGPSHASDIWQSLGISRGSIYTVLRSPEFQQLSDSRWDVARADGTAPMGPSGCFLPTPPE